MKDRIREIEAAALQEIGPAKGDAAALEAIRVKYLGRKGVVNDLFKAMAGEPDGSRRALGQMINALKQSVTAALDAAAPTVSVARGAGERVDGTLPGVATLPGAIHPITKTIDAICDIFISLGFRVVRGPEIDTEHYNFEALNIPLEHPSRDAFDTFYLDSPSGKYLLRSHTSPVQARFMEKHKPPFSIVIPGKVYRPDATDASHSFMFHQVEGLAVGDRVTFADLKGALTFFARQMFGKDTRMRFRPSFFPFTEPSAEVDISCILCGGPDSALRGTHDAQRKCSMCGGRGWLEILGAGMVNPKVFANVGYDPEKVTGFAFGMGVERIAIMKYGISDIRMFFENDVRFLRQF